MFHNAYGNEGLTAPCWPARSWEQLRESTVYCCWDSDRHLPPDRNIRLLNKHLDLRFMLHRHLQSSVMLLRPPRAPRTHRGPRLPQRGLRHTNSVRLWWPESDTSSAGNHAATGTTTENRMSYSKVS